MKIKRRTYNSVEMQMGPMIDMVFLLLVFFMVTAKPIKQESDISLTLPGTVGQDEALEIPDEQRIEILADGTVILNDLKYDSPVSHDLPQLTQTLVNFKKSSDSNRAKALVTIAAADSATHQRIVDVLNACGKADIKGVTFSSTSTEESEE